MRYERQLGLVLNDNPVADPPPPSAPNEGPLAALAVALGARTVRGWSPEEEQLTHALPRASTTAVLRARAAIAMGEDPLGAHFCALRSAEVRREAGAVYTPPPIIAAMLEWAARHIQPARVIDPGSGSGRYLVAAGRRFPDAQLVGVEIDPLAALLARAHLATAGLAERAQIVRTDYRAFTPPALAGPTLYIGNPPYVRHHQITPTWKAWLTATAKRRELEASQLAGLHVYFFLATAEHARRGDAGIFITSAEWLDVNYGSLVRELLVGDLGAETIMVLAPTAEPFPGTATTGVITGFTPAVPPPTIGLGRVESTAALGNLTTDHRVRRERLSVERRWTPLTYPAVERREGYIELGELFRVHRGQVTGSNHIWIAGEHSAGLPESVLFPSVTKARELIAARDVLVATDHLRCVIDLPMDLDAFSPTERRRIDRFLALARRRGAADSYVASHRRCWWSVGLRQPAPILATYMARRPPVFVRNVAEARHINIAHGLYPREPLDDQVLREVARFLSRQVSQQEGRTYAGGLTKFEPREMERLLIPHPDTLMQQLAPGGDP